MSSSCGEANGDSDGPWLHDWHDPVAGFVSFSQHLTMSDLHGDGNQRLVMVDMKRRLRIVQRAFIQWEQKIRDIPVAVQCYYDNPKNPTIPTLAVASGGVVFIYRHLRPLQRFLVPARTLHPEEAALWRGLRDVFGESGKEKKSEGGEREREKINEACNRLMELRSSGVDLSTLSTELVGVSGDHLRRVVVSEWLHELSLHRGKGGSDEIAEPSAVTCMGVLRKKGEEENALGSLVLGTETAKLVVLSVNADKILLELDLPAVPSFLCIVGTYEGEWRICVACRDARVISVKNGRLMASVMQVQAGIVGLARTENTLHVGSADSKLHGFHLKGRKLHELCLPSPLLSLCAAPLPRGRLQSALIVALRNGEIRLYHEKTVLHTLKLGSDSVAGMTFGSYGREEHCLALSLRSGALMIKILKRRAAADLLGFCSRTSDGTSSSSPRLQHHQQQSPRRQTEPPGQSVPLPVPKRTKLFVELADAEKQNAPEVHRRTQTGLMRLRVLVARSYVSALKREPGRFAGLFGSAVLRGEDGAVLGGQGGDEEGDGRDVEEQRPRRTPPPVLIEGREASQYLVRGVDESGEVTGVDSPSPPATGRVQEEEGGRTSGRIGKRSGSDSLQMSADVFGEFGPSFRVAVRVSNLGPKIETGHLIRLCGPPGLFRVLPLSETAGRRRVGEGSSGAVVKCPPLFPGKSVTVNLLLSITTATGRPEEVFVHLIRDPLRSSLSLPLSKKAALSNVAQLLVAPLTLPPVEEHQIENLN
uniref:Bardet-Biedl syndrome 1 N-terminal domain-containing protein n=1 Tax=Chromera velia CCMP2878 TaxID=1169474 RepID=A0A0G4GR23_9ALVE|mmetsp:Transcript_55470/g.108600  ORF Transcript_55470/g.108600 Transcript_55470/m.108600 type:complete len:760 (-) Transcript_55470:55-2334(-)|eukprot:Cvel_5083.t1-p1 / transcript=Cvel_5083.t1 / gene=Cvel_5083 / organism=Chromera_velia_CCMP2878 / gene_product=Bardet-Biedl syndrome 1 protein, putative / transcript_product=Bardet-Biedl syndrome 1 protein, putative / location=Cvel_scaffold231:94177-99848(+) / protein_length=759 / sequence_SO=supercontig / SO=protein_coding / is_pseudo=false